MTAVRAFSRAFVLEVRTGWASKVAAVALAGLGWWLQAGAAREWSLEIAVYLLFAVGCITAWVRSRWVDEALVSAPTAGFLGVVLAQSAGLLVIAMAWRGLETEWEVGMLSAALALGYAATLAPRSRWRGVRVLAGPLAAIAAIATPFGVAAGAHWPYLGPDLLAYFTGPFWPALALVLVQHAGLPVAAGFLVLAVGWHRGMRGRAWVVAFAVLTSVAPLVWVDRVYAVATTKGEFRDYYHPGLMLLSHVELDGRRVGPFGGLVEEQGSVGSILIARPEFYGWPGTLTLVGVDGDSVDCGGVPARREPGWESHVVWRSDGRAAFVLSPAGWLTLDLDAGCGTAPPGGLAWLGSERVWVEDDAVLIEGRDVGRREGATLLTSPTFAAGFSGGPGESHTPFLVRESGLVDLEGSVGGVNGWVERRGGLCARRALTTGCDASWRDRRFSEEAAPPDPLPPRCARRADAPAQAWTCWRVRDGRRFVHPPGGYPLDVDLSATNPGLLNLETAAAGGWPGADPWFATPAGGKDVSLADPTVRGGTQAIRPDGTLYNMHDKIFGLE